MHGSKVPFNGRNTLKDGAIEPVSLEKNPLLCNHCATALLLSLGLKISSLFFFPFFLFLIYSFIEG